MDRRDIYENIFSVAAGLDQSGRFKNYVHVKGNTVYVFNFDKTVLIRSQADFEITKEPVSFSASDYEGDKWETDGDYVIFSQTQSNWEKKKRCLMPAQRFDYVEKIWKQVSFVAGDLPYIWFHKLSQSLLYPDLSHVEFVGKDGEVNIIQRDIFSGTQVILARPKTGLLMNSAGDNIKRDFGPIGMRTADFSAILMFQERVKIMIPCNDYFLIEGDRFGMKAVVGGCLYDGIGNINVVREKGESDGRQIEKERNSVDQTHRENKEGGSARVQQRPKRRL